MKQAVPHDEANQPNVPEIRQRIPVEHDEIGALPCLQ